VIGRVRAIIITPADTLLMIKRTRPGASPYWVLPGGAVEPTDASLEAALDREIREEIAGDAGIIGLLHTTETNGEQERFYLARIRHWSFDDRTGPEFSVPGRDEYLLEEVPLTVEALDAVYLKLDEIALLLREAIQQGDLLARVNPAGPSVALTHNVRRTLSYSARFFGR
jgi:ADP-ribose pyrophosphatase YjhB (NUDIX family)